MRALAVLSLFCVAAAAFGSAGVVVPQTQEGKFNPTTEWQELRPGQAAPPQCDVRVDLKTGTEYARLKPKAQPAGFSESEEEVDSGPSPEESRAAAAAKMYEILLGLPEVPPELETEKITKLSPEELRELITKLWNRRQEYLRDVYEDVETEQEILQGNVNMLRMLTSPKDNEDIVRILEEVEYLVSNVDNARTLANLDGWKPIVALLEGNSTQKHETDDQVIRMAAWTVGTAVKMDEEVQEAALDAGAMAALTALLKESGPFEVSMSAKTKIFFAIGNLVRGNRRAQRIFYTGQGFETMRMAFKSGAAEAAGVEGERQNSKLFALVQDLFSDPTTLPSILKALKDSVWCGAVAEATAAAAKTHTQELGLQAMLVLHGQTGALCDEVFFAPDLAAKWAGWGDVWAAQSTEHGDELKALVDELLGKRAS